MRAMVGRGDLGQVRLVMAEFAHGHHADAADAANTKKTAYAVIRFMVPVCRFV